MKRPAKNLAASLQAHLRRRAADTQLSYNEVLDYYAMEKFLARLLASPYADKFVLKGGLLFHIWQYPLRRSTRDIDLQAATDNSVEYITALIKQICGQRIEADGIEFDPAQISGKPINLQSNVPGVRVKCLAKLQGTNVAIPFNVDVSFAATITPGEVEQDYPTLLPDTPALRIHTYPAETALAEKLEAIVSRGVSTGRLNDFFDLYVLATYGQFAGTTVRAAIRATFLNRSTLLPLDTPPALSADFALSGQAEWSLYLNEINQAASEAAVFSVVLERLRTFLLPPLHAAAEDADFNAHWPPGGPWQD